MLRLSPLLRLVLVSFAVLFTFHFLASSLSSGSDDQLDDLGWSERLGLDHYAEFEQGVAGRLGDGFGRVKEGLGVIGGGLGWGKKGRGLGGLYDLVATSNPSPRPAYYDFTTSIDRIRLASTRVLGHGMAGGATEPDDDLAGKPRRHILVTGGFGSLGKQVIRDLLLNLEGGGAGASVGPGLGMGLGKGRLDFDSFDETIGGGGGAFGLGDEEDILVTLLDVEDKTDELNHLLQSSNIGTATSGGKAIKGTDPRTQAFTSSEHTVATFKRSGKLRVVIGDVRDEELITTLLSPGGMILEGSAAGGEEARPRGRPKLSKGHVSTKVVIPPVSGIIHLAAYNPSACRLNPTDCKDVEDVGMSNILGGLKRTGMESETLVEGGRPTIADRPWIVMPRRGEPWAEIPNGYNANSSSASISAPQLALKDFTVQYPLHSMLLTLPSYSSIVGDPYMPRFDPVPHIIQSALGNLPIQVYTLGGENTHDDFIAIDDVAQSIIQGARMLELASQKDYLRALGFVSELNVVGPVLPASPTAGPLAQFAKIAMSVTMSQSPFAEILETPTQDSKAAEEWKKSRELGRANDRKTLNKVLGFAPATTVRNAIKTYVDSLLALQSEHLTKKINVACSSPPSVPVLEEGLLGLSGCNVQLLTLLEGSYYTLGCSAGLEEPHLTPLSVVGAIPFKEGVRGVEVVAERGMEGKVDLQLRCPSVDDDGKINGDSDVVVWADTADGGEFAESNKAGDRTIAEWFTVDFVKRESRSFTLTLPPTEGMEEGEEPKRRLVLRDPTGQSRELIFQPVTSEMRPLYWKINPICCSSAERKKDLWDFFKEDPVITSQVTFPSEDGRTSLAESTLSVQKCKNLRLEHDKIVKIRKYLKSPLSDKPCEAERGEATHWDAKEWVTCQIDCTAPLVCLSADKCKCTRDRCGDPRARGPFSSVAYTSSLSYEAPEVPATPMDNKPMGGLARRLRKRQVVPADEAAALEGDQAPVKPEELEHLEPIEGDQAPNGPDVESDANDEVRHDEAAPRPLEDTPVDILDDGEAAEPEPVKEEVVPAPAKPAAHVAPAKAVVEEPEKPAFVNTGTTPESRRLIDRIESIPWDSIILPGARRAFATPIEELPQVNVVQLPDTIDTHMTSPACYDLDKSPLPFLGDHLLVEALRKQSLPIEEADFVMVPYFQGCYYNYLQENTFKKLAETVGFAETRIAAVDHISASKIAIPFTHDFGSCTGWWPRLEDVLGRSPPSPMDQAVAWQVNGDYNTRCIKPDRDVIIPAVSKHSKVLASTFDTYDKVAPVLTRQHLAFFAGGVRGFGAVARTRIGCGRTSQEAASANILYQQFSEGKRYIGTLNSAKFCLLPRGIPAWTTRTFEAIYAGCIPAFIVDRNIFPFQDILDYSLFSVTIPEADANRVEEILSAYTDEQLFELQAHLLKVREAFLFKEGEEWERKGPLFYSLVSMSLRLYLGYPAVGRSCEVVGDF